LGEAGSLAIKKRQGGEVSLHQIPLSEESNATPSREFFVAQSIWRTEASRGVTKTLNRGVQGWAFLAAPLYARSTLRGWWAFS